MTRGRTDDTRPARPDEMVRQGAEALGVPADMLPEQTPEDDEAEMCRVWRINWRAFQLFVGCETQWRVVAPAQAGLIWLGLDYAAVKALLDCWPRTVRRQASQIMADLRIMEAEAMTVLNEAAP